MSKKGKYNKYKIEAWDDSEGVLTKDQIEYLIQDEQRMQAEEIAEALEDRNKLFNSVHIKYETNDPNATTEPVTDTELDEALQEELRIMSDETVDLLSKHMKRYVVCEKNKINIEENHTFECLIKDDIGLTNDEREFLLALKTKAVSKDRLVY